MKNPDPFRNSVIAKIASTHVDSYYSIESRVIYLEQFGFILNWDMTMEELVAEEVKLDRKNMEANEKYKNQLLKDFPATEDDMNLDMKISTVKELPIWVTYQNKRVQGTCMAFDEKTRIVSVKLKQYDGVIVKFKARKYEKSFSDTVKKAFKPKLKSHAK